LTADVFNAFREEGILIEANESSGSGLSVYSVSLPLSPIRTMTKVGTIFWTMDFSAGMI
jgi:hypothetical protein